MTLAFDKEVIFVGGFPIVGEITVEAEGERDADHLWSLDLAVTGFEPEDGRTLTWRDAQAPCDAWLAANKARVEREALK